MRTGTIHVFVMLYVHDIPYLRKKGPWAVHLTLGQDCGDGLIFEVSVSQIDMKVKERPGKLTTDIHYSNSSCGYYWFQPYSRTVINQEWERLAMQYYFTVWRWWQSSVVIVTSCAGLFFCAEGWHKASSGCLAGCLSILFEVQSS